MRQQETHEAEQEPVLRRADQERIPEPGQHESRKYQHAVARGYRAREDGQRYERGRGNELGAGGNHTLVEQQGRDQHDAPGAAEACEGEGPSIAGSGNGQLQFPRAAHYSF